MEDVRARGGIGGRGGGRGESSAGDDSAAPYSFDTIDGRKDRLCCDGGC